jgi:membrane protein YqaA with SNARE-associated domain
MRRLVAWAERFGESLGGPGLFVVAFLDASFLSLPQVNDLLVMGLVVARADRMLYYAAMATSGSIAGCLVIYGLGRRGGEAVARRRVASARSERVLRAFARYGVLAVAVPALLPPPAPFKLFVLLAGVARVPLAPFVAAVAGGRGVRYFGEAWLAARYGEAALGWMDAHGRTASAVAAAAVLVGGIGYLAWRRLARATQLG